MTTQAPDDQPPKEATALAEVYQRPDGKYDAVLIFKDFDNPQLAVDFIDSIMTMISVPEGATKN